MSEHNIVGSERSGPHYVIRRFKPVRRRTFLDVVLSAIGSFTILTISLIALWAYLTPYQ